MSKSAIVLGLALLLGSALTADDKPKGQATAGGKVKSVDATAKTLTITEKASGKERDIVIRLAAEAKVRVDGKEAKLEDVPAGARHVTVHGGKLEASRVTDAEWVTVIGLQRLGIVKKVSGETLTYKPDVPVGNTPADVTVKLAPHGTVTFGGKEISLAELKAGDKVNILYTADDLAALRIGKEVPKKKP